MENKRFKLIGLGIAGFIIILVSATTYFIKFHGDPDDQQATWGMFGDFIGGTTNPLLALLTYLAVLWTLSLSYESMAMQKKQHDENVEFQNNLHLEQQTNQYTQNIKEDIFRVVEVIHKECISLLEISKVTNAFNTPVNTEVQLVYFLKNFEVNNVDPINLKDWGIINTDYKEVLNDLCVKLTILRQLLVKFDELSGNVYVSEYYRLFYSRYSHKLCIIGHLDGDIANYFKANM